MNRLRSNIRSDERVVFFATDAARVGPTWQIPIHAWVHELEPARKRKAMLASLIEHAIGLEIADEARAYFERRVGLMCADNEGRKRIIPLNLKCRKHTSCLQLYNASAWKLLGP